MRLSFFAQIVVSGVFALAASCSSSSSSKLVKIGVDPTFYPIQAGNKDIYVFAFFNELLEEVAKLKKIRIERISRSWDNLVDGLNRHEYNLIFSSMEPRIYNEGVYEFSPIILSTGPVVVVPMNSPIEELEHLSNTIVGVEEFSQGAIQISRDPTVVLSYFMSPSQALNDLVAGNYQAVVLDSIIAYSYVNDLFQSKLRILQQPLIEQGIRVLSLQGTAKSDLKMIQEGIQELKEKGTYEALLKKWNLSSSS